MSRGLGDVYKRQTDKLIDSKLADARVKHGWVTVKGADTVVTKDK